MYFVLISLFIMQLVSP